MDSHLHDSPFTFTLLCISGFLFSISYGVTFLIPSLVAQQGGNEALAGVIIASASVSTVFLIIFSGHIADKFSLTLAVALSGIFLSLSSLLFAIIPSKGSILTIPGFILGIGWGLFYTLAPILVAALIDPPRRTHFFALLSGSMMAGIGTAPITGRIVSALNMPIETAFLFASFTSLIGTLILYTLHRKLHQKHTPQIRKLSRHSTKKVLQSHALYPIIIVGLGGAIFGSLSSFQTSYATLYQLDYALFFIGFISAVIIGRLFLSAYVVSKDPLYALAFLTSLSLLSLLLFLFPPTHHNLFYLFTAVILGTGYGLTYSVINGLAANDAPSDCLPQSLLLFSLSYFIGLFGFPLIAGSIISSWGIQPMLFSLLCLSILTSAIVFSRIASRSSTHKKN